MVEADGGGWVGGLGEDFIFLLLSDFFSSCRDFECLNRLVSRWSPERPLHHAERVLEQVLEWSGLDCPSSAYLVIKRFPEAKAGADGKGSVCKWWQHRKGF